MMGSIRLSMRRLQDSATTRFLLMNLFLETGTEQSKNNLVVRCSTGYCADFAISGLSMLSVIIETRNDEDALARTLGPLVAGAVEGIIREVIVCDLGSTDRTHRVADAMGCEFVPSGGVPAGIRLARADWLLLLEPGSRLCAGWMEAVIHHANATDRPARFTRSRLERPSFLSRLLASRRPLVDGLLIQRMQALKLAQAHGDAATIARKVSAKRLSGEIFLAQPA